MDESMLLPFKAYQPGRDRYGQEEISVIWHVVDENRTCCEILAKVAIISANRWEDDGRI